MSRMSRTSIAKARRTWALLLEIVRTVEIVAGIVAAAEDVRAAEAADADVGAADVTVEEAVDGMAVAMAGTAAADGTNFHLRRFTRIREKGLRLWSRPFCLFAGRLRDCARDSRRGRRRYGFHAPFGRKSFLLGEQEIP